MTMTEADWQKMYFMAAERHNELGAKTLKLAGEGRWWDLVAYVIQALENIDAVLDEDFVTYEERAKPQAQAAERAVFGNLISEPVRMYDRPPLNQPEAPRAAPTKGQ